MSDANHDVEGLYDDDIDHEIIKGNRDTLLDRLEAPGYHDGFPYGLIDEVVQEIKLLRKERDAADSSLSRILSEINCRIDHGADSNGHLEGIYGIFKKDKTQ